MKTLKGIDSPCSVCVKACESYSQCNSCDKFYPKETMIVSRGEKNCLNCTSDGFHRMNIGHPIDGKKRITLGR